MRWSRFKNESPAEMYAIVSEHVFPFLRTLGGDGSTYAHHMKILRDAKLKKHFHTKTFHGFDFDNTMLRIDSMSMLLHGEGNHIPKAFSVPTSGCSSGIFPC